jgi:hypothetical protein
MTLDNDDVIRHLRGLPAAELQTLLADARIASGWTGYRDDGELVHDDDEEELEPESGPLSADDPGPLPWVERCHELRLTTITGHLILYWERWRGRWTIYSANGSAPRTETIYSAAAVQLEDLEDLAEGWGYRLPWRPVKRA